MPRKTLLILSLALNVAFVLFFIGKRIYWTYYRMPTAYEYNEEDYMRATAQKQNALPIDTADWVFVGNSLTSNFPVEEMMGPGLKNRGIAGNKTGDILQRIESIAQYRPAGILVEAGINDLNEKKSVKEIFINYKSIIDLIREVSPGTQIIIQSTLPVCKTSLPLMPGVDSLNNLLKECCWRYGLDYLDLHKVLRKGNGLDSACTWDGIHLNYEGYRRWAAEVKKLF